MKAGELRHRVTIQKTQSTLDAAGQTSDAWVKVAEVWAAVEPLSGRELVVAQQIQPDATHQVRMRYRDDVTAKMRVLYAGRHLYLAEPPRNTDERNREIKVLCMERE